MTPGTQLVCIYPGPFAKELKRDTIYRVALDWPPEIPLVSIDEPGRVFPRYYHLKRFAALYHSIHPVAMDREPIPA